MGAVVDSDHRVIGVTGMGVVDASVIPPPISCPIQACVYALAEQASDIILGGLRRRTCPQICQIIAGAEAEFIVLKGASTRINSGVGLDFRGSGILLHHQQEDTLDSESILDNMQA